MPHLSAILNSSVGKKFLQAITGLGLFVFVIGHLIGNLLLLLGADAFNHYAKFLEELGHGMLVPAADFGLLMFFLVHAVTGFRVAVLDRGRARPVGYQKTGNAGGRSRKSIASMSMIVTGVLLLIFVPVHLANFKYGAFPAAPLGYYGPQENQIRDLYTVVEHLFADPFWVGFYVVVMVALGFHLWHGVWSAFQSLGATHPRWMPFLTLIGHGFAVLLAIGFVYLPIYMNLNQRNFDQPAPPVTTPAANPTGGPQ